jgi:hypothetical protein
MVARATIGSVISLCGALFLAVSCAPVHIAGRDFPRAAFAELHLRTTTDQQAETLLGPPFKRLALQGTATNPAGPLPVGKPFSVAILSYAYGISNGGPDVSGHAVGKFATLVFFEGRLAAYDLDSTIPGDANPPIDDARLAQLHQGTTTRNDIINLMGPPSGQSTAFSFVPQSRGHITYVWTHFDGTDVRHKILVIELDANDVMTRYALVDRSGPLPSTQVVPELPGDQAPPPIAVPKSRPVITRT